MAQTYQWYICLIYIMIFSSENIMIYINENINRILLWFTYFYNFDKFETPLISLINSIVVVVCWMLIAEPVIFLVNLDDVMWWLVNWRDASFTTVSVTLQFTKIYKLLSLIIIICILWCYRRLNKTSDVWNFENVRKYHKYRKYPIYIKNIMIFFDIY